MYIHEHENWTDFRWSNEAVALLLDEVCREQGKLLGRLSGLGFDSQLRAMAENLTRDVVYSSEIEGIRLNVDEVRSSIARRLGIEHVKFTPSSHYVEGVVAVIHTPDNSLSSLNLSDNPLIIVIEGVEKPGNIGAILRSADAAHADAVLICDPLTDLYNPNLIRASIGAVFTVPCAVTDSADCIRFLKEHNIQILTAQLQDSELYYDSDMTSPTAIVMGTEATGLTNQWREAADSHIRIPMLGSLDSLNVSVSTAILLFEAVRQRQQH